MKTGPGMRGTNGGSEGSANLARSGSPVSKSKDEALHHVIERIVVSTCFKGALPEADSMEDQSEDRQVARHDTDKPINGRARAVRRQAEDQIKPASPGASAMASVKRFIAVLDKIYDKVLSDGDFDYVGFMRARSLGPSEMLDLLEACAVRLGEEWNCDSLGFVTVTVATSRLQRVLTTLSQENRCFEPVAHDRSMLLIVPRGETHTFAVSLIEERFRLRGWETSMVFADRLLDLPHLLKTSDFQLVCIAWLDSELKNRVESVLHAIRTSVNRDRTCVIAGGPAAVEYSQWLEERGVEKVCSNAQIALETAQRHGATRNSALTATDVNGSLLEPLRSA
ncbi:hypothetical protein WNZ14_08360 [Hoeflea sp. AS60]|uniref:hypothetical protein n=1 Tax=Hoeflea sp. AS60 TaxID=3135780 RepID=UPI00316B5684